MNPRIPKKYIIDRIHINNVKFILKISGSHLNVQINFGHIISLPPIESSYINMSLENLSRVVAQLKEYRKRENV